MIKGGHMILQGKRALITGGSSGIGLAIAEPMLAKGAKVAITGRRRDVLTEAAKQLRQTARGVETIAGDVSTGNGREKPLQLALQTLGGLHILRSTPGRLA